MEMYIILPRFCSGEFFTLLSSVILILIPGSRFLEQHYTLHIDCRMASIITYTDLDVYTPAEYNPPRIRMFFIYYNACCMYQPTND